MIAGGAFDHRSFGERAGHVPHPFDEEGLGPVEGLGLHVLRDGDGDCAGFDGSVRTRIPASRALGNCSGRHTRSKYRETGLKASLTVTSPLDGSSSSCKTGALARVAKVSAGRSNTGRRLMVASAAPGDHIGGTGADAGRDRPRLQAVLHAGVRDSRVHHRLFIAAEHVGECRLTAGGRDPGSRPARCLPQSGDVAVPEDSEAAGEQLGALAVAFGGTGWRGSGRQLEKR